LIKVLIPDRKYKIVEKVKADYKFHKRDLKSYEEKLVNEYYLIKIRENEECIKCEFLFNKWIYFNFL